MKKNHVFFAFMVLIAVVSLTGCRDNQEKGNNGIDNNGIGSNVEDNTTSSLIKITPRDGLKISESEQQAAFEVSLLKEPQADVSITLTGLPDTEGKIYINKLVFTPENWNRSQTVLVSGVDDDLNDGDQIFEITFEVSSDDAEFDKYEIDPVDILNVDNEMFGFEHLNTLYYVAPEQGLVTDEFGTMAFISFRLSSKPTDEVLVRLESTNPSEAVPEISSFVIDPDNWEESVDIPISGVDDDVKDGVQPFNIVIKEIVSDDPNIKAEAFDYRNSQFSNVISGQNYDNDGDPLNELIVNKISKDSNVNTRNITADNVVSEDGTYVEYTVRLKNPPKDVVFIEGKVSDNTEGKVEPKFYAFTDYNYDVEKVFKIYGVDDNERDGDMLFGVDFITTSSDLASAELDHETLIFVNQDNDEGMSEAPEVSIVVNKKYDVLYTNEDGQSKSFKVKLSNQPLDTVYVEVKVSNYTEGLLYSDASEDDSLVRSLILEFTPLNWNVGQQVYVQGVDDDKEDGEIYYRIFFTSISEDERFDGLKNQFYCLNYDNDLVREEPEYDYDFILPYEDLIVVSGVDLDSTNFINRDEQSFSVSLSSIPSSDVNMRLTSGYSASFINDDGSKSNSLDLVFTTFDYDQAKKVKFQVNDSTLNGKAFEIRVASVTSRDDERYMNLKNPVKVTYQYQENSYSSDIPVQANPVDLDDEVPRVVFSPNVCNAIGAISSDNDLTPVNYSLHLSSQPKSDVTVKFSIPQEYKRVIGFKDDVDTITFKPTNFNVDQDIGFVYIVNDPSVKTMRIDYTLISEDENFNGDDLYGCTIQMYNMKDGDVVYSHYDKLRIVTANTSSGYGRYDEAGMNMFYALDPDIIIIQEFADASEYVVNSLENYFSNKYNSEVKYSYYADKYKYNSSDKFNKIGNGIIVKGENKIKETYQYQSPVMSDRNFDAALIDIPGDKDLLAISLHLATENTKRAKEYPEVVNFINEINPNNKYYVVIGGDLNSGDITTIHSYWKSVVDTSCSESGSVTRCSGKYPSDQLGNQATNNSNKDNDPTKPMRRKHLDWLFADKKFTELAVPVMIGERAFPFGYVLDPRVQDPIEDIYPSVPEDFLRKGVGIQHMPVVRDFLIGY